jgi:hypothetical protein
MITQNLRDDLDALEISLQEIPDSPGKSAADNCRMLFAHLRTIFNSIEEYLSCCPEADNLLAPKKATCRHCKREIVGVPGDNGSIWVAKVRYGLQYTCFDNWHGHEPVEGP